MPATPLGLLECAIKDATSLPFKIRWEHRTALSEQKVQQLQEQGRFSFWENYQVKEGYRVPVLLESEPERLIFYQTIKFSIGDYQA